MVMVNVLDVLVLFGLLIAPIWVAGGCHSLCVAATNGNKKLMSAPQWKIPLLIIQAAVLGPFGPMYTDN